MKYQNLFFKYIKSKCSILIYHLKQINTSKITYSPILLSELTTIKWNNVIRNPYVIIRLFNIEYFLFSNIFNTFYLNLLHLNIAQIIMVETIIVYPINQILIYIQIFYHLPFLFTGFNIFRINFMFLGLDYVIPILQLKFINFLYSIIVNFFNLKELIRYWWKYFHSFFQIFLINQSFISQYFSISNYAWISRCYNVFFIYLSQMVIFVYMIEIYYTRLLVKGLVIDNVLP